jgi:hypothetical protein
MTTEAALTEDGFPEAIAQALGQAPVRNVADLGGRSLPLALAAWRRWGATLHLVDVDRHGQAPSQPGSWIAPYRAALSATGVPPERIVEERGAEDGQPWDLVLSLDGFADRWGARGLEPVLNRRIHAQTRMLVDIRKGSGAFPLLRRYGTCQTLSRRQEGEKTVERVLFHAGPDAAQRAPATPELSPPAPADDWAGIAAVLTGPGGFFTENGRHSFLFVPRGRTLVVTFDNLDIAMTKREERLPWGYGFIEKQDWSMLGVMAAGWTWYRDPWVAAEFERLVAEGFFARFERVVFYGASMGGYAACAFAAAVPGAEVVAISPQSTLDHALVPWETRYVTAWGYDYGGPYGDAAAVSRKAARVTLLYDPYEPLDAAHVARFDGANVVKLRAPLLGHRLGTALQQMGLLSPITLGALNGTLEPLAYYRLLRARRDFPRYQRELFRRALARGRPGLARRVGNWVLARGENRAIAKAMRSL